MSEELLILPIEQIAVIDRARKDMGDLPALVADMMAEEEVDGLKRMRGQLQPGIVRPATQDDVKLYDVDPAKTPWILVAGGRRYAAVCMAGLDTYKAVSRGSLSPMLQRIYEYHENLLRKDLSWDEEVLIKAEIHELRKQTNPGWVQGNTADEIKESVANVSRDLALAAELKKNPALANAPTKVAAVNIVKTRRAAEERTEKIKSVPKEKLAKRLVHSDMVDFIRGLPDQSVALSFLDLGRLPYEFDASDFQPSTFTADMNMLNKMLPQLYRVTKQTGWLIILTRHDLVGAVEQSVRSICTIHGDLITGITADATYCSAPTAGPASKCNFIRAEDPCWILVTPGSAQPAHQPDLHATNQYHPLIVVNMGNGALTQRHKSNVFSFPVPDEDDRTHPLQLDFDFCKELIQRLTVGGERVAEFGFGSGTFLAAAASLQRDFIGCESDSTLIDPALVLVSENMSKA